MIIDAPPVLAVTDAQLLSRHADGAILVGVPGKSRKIGLTRSVEAIRGIGAKIYGVVLNRASASRFTRLAYGDAEYGYAAYGAYGYGAATGYDEGAIVPDDAEDSQVDVEQAGGPAEPITAVTSSPAEPPHRSRGRRAAPSDREQE